METENPHLENITEIINPDKKYQWVKTEERDKFYIIAKYLPMKYSRITKRKKEILQQRKLADLTK